jgi:hypothetical protein
MLSSHLLFWGFSMERKIAGSLRRSSPAGVPNGVPPTCHALAHLGYSLGLLFGTTLYSPVVRPLHDSPAEKLALFQPVAQEMGQTCVEFDVTAVLTYVDVDGRFIRSPRFRRTHEIHLQSGRNSMSMMTLFHKHAPLQELVGNSRLSNSHPFTRSLYSERKQPKQLTRGGNTHLAGVAQCPNLLPKFWLSSHFRTVLGVKDSILVVRYLDSGTLDLSCGLRRNMQREPQRKPELQEIVGDTPVLRRSCDRPLTRRKATRLRS